MRTLLGGKSKQVRGKKEGNETHLQGIPICLCIESSWEILTKADVEPEGRGMMVALRSHVKAVVGPQTGR